MKFLAFAVVMSGVFVASGCRHDYNPTPPPYYCQPACGCAPACSNPCAPSTTPYLSPTPTTIPRPSPYASPPAGTTYTPPPAATYPAPGTGTYAPTGSGLAAPAIPTHLRAAVRQRAAAETTQFFARRQRNKKPFAGEACEGLGRFSLVCTTLTRRAAGLRSHAESLCVRGDRHLLRSTHRCGNTCEKFRKISPLSWHAFSSVTTTLAQTLPSPTSLFVERRIVSSLYRRFLSRISLFRGKANDLRRINPHCLIRFPAVLYILCHSGQSAIRRVSTPSVEMRR